MPTPAEVGDPWVRAVFTVNFSADESSMGYVDELADGTYGIRPLDENGQPNLSSQENLVFTKGFKTGVNRIQWRFDYMEQDGNGSQAEYEISSSGRFGMEDFKFTLVNDRDILETTVVFQSDLEGRYYNNDSQDPADHLPSLMIAKDAATDLIIKLNDQVVWEDEGNTVTSQTISLPIASVQEGRNQLKIETEKGDGSQGTWDYSFLYDSALRRSISHPPGWTKTFNTLLR